MSERGENKLGRQPDEVDDKPAKGQLSRRAFLLGGVAVAGAALVGGGPKAIKEASRFYKKYEADNFNADVEKEKSVVGQDIAKGLQDEQRYSALLLRHNDLVKQSKVFDKNSADCKILQQGASEARQQLNSFYVEKGSMSYGLLGEANPHAQELERDVAAVSNLATARVLYRNGVSSFTQGKKELVYWHNCALAYRELGKQTQDQIKEKIAVLFEYAEINDVDVAQISQEQILYCLIDEDFDFSLKPAAVEAELNKNFPQWKKHPATHHNKDTYAHYNDLSVLDIFELNRLKAVLQQLNNPDFRSDIFSTRNQDLRNWRTELGGVIPRPDQKNELEVVPARYSISNSAYVVSNEAAMRQFSGAASFHLHATKEQEPSDAQGPSGADQAFFAPGVIFSSLGEDSVLAHFYVSRAKFKFGSPVEVKNDVICLGEITRP